MSQPLRGRQAEAARNDQLVLHAAREVFGEFGFDAPISAVAERAGVGVGSLYRRYGSKDELLQQLCLMSMKQNLRVAEEALRSRDAWAGLTGYITACVGFSGGALAPVAGKVEATDEMWRLARNVQEAIEELTRRAHAEGTLREDANATDIAWLIEHFSRGLPSSPSPGDDPIRRRQLAISLHGLRPGSPEALPEPVPTWRDYQARWQDRGVDGA